MKNVFYTLILLAFVGCASGGGLFGENVVDTLFEPYLDEGEFITGAEADARLRRTCVVSFPGDDSSARERALSASNPDAVASLCIFALEVDYRADALAAVIADMAAAKDPTAEALGIAFLAALDVLPRK